MKEIRIGGSDRPAIIDDEDYDLISKHNWFVKNVGRASYAVTMVLRNEKRGTESMHRMILNPMAGQCIDHINHDGLCNRRDNLRIATHSQNSAHMRKKIAAATSRMKGVHLGWHGKWRAAIKRGGKTINLGYFESEEEAGAAYNVYARKLFGQFAVLNSVPKELEDAVAPRIENPKKRGIHSRFVGVFPQPWGKWTAFISIARHRSHLGTFDTEEDAAKAYNAHAAPLGRRLNSL